MLHSIFFILHSRYHLMQKGLVNCVICGCHFRLPRPPSDDENGWGFEVPTKAQVEFWLRHNRLIGTTSTLKEFTSSPFVMPKNHSNTDGLFVSGHAEYSDSTSFSLNGVEFEVMSLAQDGRNTIFPLHGACFEIMQYYINWYTKLNPDSSLSLASIYRILCAQYADDIKLSWYSSFIAITSHRRLLLWRGLHFGHRYHGASKRWSLDSSWQDDMEKEWYCIDPIQLSAEVGALVWQSAPMLLSEPKRTKVHELCILNRPRYNPPLSPPSILEEIPIEIFQLITDLLPIQAILRLRSCSRGLKGRIPLDQGFWRRQLHTYNLVPFLWDLSETERPEAATGEEIATLPNWKTMAQYLVRGDYDYKKEIQDVAPASWGLWNRMRIWTLVSYLAEWAERGGATPPDYAPSPPAESRTVLLSSLYHWFTA
ncbi:hypothetical protein BGZ63DRAFT_464578 [Mariannaea sp. PMI_226]|nr:hypothetical protein BGZ63DRAFT_464578 [Mariannaea sp. PMI_226]